MSNIGGFVKWNKMCHFRESIYHYKNGILLLLGVLGRLIMKSMLTSTQGKVGTDNGV